MYVHEIRAKENYALRYGRCLWKMDMIFYTSFFPKTFPLQKKQTRHNDAFYYLISLKSGPIILQTERTADKCISSAAD